MKQPSKLAVEQGTYLVAGEGFEPSTFGLCVPLRFRCRRNRFVVWTFSSPSACYAPSGACHKSYPSLSQSRLESLARDYLATGFPSLTGVAQKFFLRSHCRMR